MADTVIDYKPIETAPRDGTPVLLKGGFIDDCSDFGDDIGHIYKRPAVAHWANDDWIVCTFDMGVGIKYESPTHWASL